VFGNGKIRPIRGGWAGERARNFALHESGDSFAASLASADFDRDGYSDLAIGQPYDAVGRLEWAGSVTVVYGSPTGLDTNRSTGFVQPGGAQDYVWWGSSLAASDFNGDDFPDLAVGAPGDDYQELPDEDYGPSGTVRILLGGASGLTTTGLTLLRRQGGTSGFDVGFGTELASGDLNRDGLTDLVVGSDGDRFIDEGYPGGITVCAGRTGGPSGCSRVAQDRDLAALTSIAVGNMSADARPEIAVGVPWSEEGDPGSVQVLQLKAGSPVSLARRLSFTQSSAGVPGSDEVGDSFGDSVALGDVDGGGYADLVVGASGEDDADGRVTLIHGAASGWRTSGNVSFDQNYHRTTDIPETLDYNRMALITQALATSLNDSTISALARRPGRDS
jgi:hypothetical protein